MRGTRRQERHAPAHARKPGANKLSHAAGEDLTAAVAVALPGGSAPELGVRGGTTTETTTEPETAAPEPARETAPRAPSRVGRAPRGRALLRGVVRRDRTLMVGGAELRLLVLACTQDGTTAVDLASRSLLRLRITWPDGHAPDLSPFDVVGATLADDPECDDLAQPEAVTVAAPPRRIGPLRGRRVRKMLARLAATHDGPLLGFHGPSAPYWDFRGLRPSVALIHPTRGPQLMRRRDGSTWVRFGWERDDVWLPVEDERAIRALDASRRDRLAGKQLTAAFGFSPHYLLVAVSSPRAAHCYKVCAAVLPKG